MHDILLYLAIVWAWLLLAASVYRVARAETLIGRVLALDTVILIVAVILALFAYLRDSVFYLDTVLVLILLAFVGTLAAARYASEDTLFS